MKRTETERWRIVPSSDGSWHARYKRTSLRTNQTESRKKHKFHKDAQDQCVKLK